VNEGTKALISYFLSCLSFTGFSGVDMSSEHFIYYTVEFD